MRVLLIVFLAATIAAAQQSSSAEEAESPAPTMNRSASGVIVIKGSEPSAPPAGETPAEQTAETGTPAAAEEEAPAEPTPPRRREVRSFTYDANGRRVPVPLEQTTRRTGDTEIRVVTLSNINGKTVPYLREVSTETSETETAQRIERRVQRYDPAGRPVQQDLIIEERKLLPNGTIETVATRYVEDMNGRMRPESRTVTREVEQGGAVRTVKTEEQVDSRGHFRTAVKEETIEKETASGRQIETVRYVDDGGGRMTQAEREASELSQSGDRSTTRSRIWKRDPLTGKMRLTERVEAEIRKTAEGVEQETIQTYGYATAAGSTNLNATRMELQEIVQREIRQTAGGGQRVRTTVQGRDPAETSRMAARQVTETVAKPQPGGEGVETRVYEQDVNGRLRPSQVIVEEVEN